MDAGHKIVYYRLTKEAAISGWSDTEEAIGRWFKSYVYEKPGIGLKDYCYPYALQEDGSWMMCGRVVCNFSLLDLYDSLPADAKNETSN